MLQRKDDFFHGYLAFEDEPTRVKQGQTRDQTQDKMAIIGICRANLAGLRRQ
jgi:hypothetical protein